MLCTHSWRAGTEYSPKWMNIPNLSWSHHAILSERCASVSPKMRLGGFSGSAATAIKWIAVAKAGRNILRHMYTLL